ncbi:MAG TPA: zf-TFIIB domain-containing protein [Candidatus Binataceae bacterium]|nr:zf-TFIIB domain-containing protein [Candidatus Binataceae bacterium]
MVDEKDRLGQKLHDVEAARENQWARQHDIELIEKLRQKKKAGETLCPQCHKTLVPKTHGKHRVLACPDNEGAWLDSATLKALIEHSKK